MSKMRFKNKSIIAIVMILALSIFMAGCSDDKSDVSVSTDKESSPEATSSSTQATAQPQDWCSKLGGRLNKRYIDDLERYESGCQYSIVEGDYIKYHFVTEEGDINLVETFVEKTGQLKKKELVGIHKNGERCEIVEKFEPYEMVKNTC